MKKLIRNSVFASAIALTGVTFTPLVASPLPQYQSQRQDNDQDQNRDRDQAKDQDQNRDRDQSKDQDQNRDRDQARDHDRDQDRNRDHAMSDNDSAYYGNRYYKQGWEDGLHHKHKDRKMNNDDDRRAYEAGYAHGDRGEKWQKPHQDNDRH